MHSLRSRRGPLLGGVVGATVLLTASAAFACTSTAGKYTIAGINGATGSATYQGNGKDENDSSGGYCLPGLPTSRVTLQNSNPNKLDFSIAVSKLGCVAGSADDLPEGTYDVRWVKSENAIVVNGKCHKARADLPPSGITVREWIPLGDINVTSSTTTTKNFSLDSVLLGTALDYFRGPGNICLAFPEGLANAGNLVSPLAFMRWNVI